MVREVKGCLSLLGNSRQPNSKQREYSVIEIGGQVLQNIIISTKLDNFLSRGLSWDGECILFLTNNFILAVTTPDGKTYCDPEDGFAAFIVIGLVGVFVVLGAFALFEQNSSASGLLVLCVGALLIWAAYDATKKILANNSFLKSLKVNSGAIEIK